MATSAGGTSLGSPGMPSDGLKTSTVGSPTRPLTCANAARSDDLVGRVGRQPYGPEGVEVGRVDASGPRDEHGSEALGGEAPGHGQPHPGTGSDDDDCLGEISHAADRTGFRAPLAPRGCSPGAYGRRDCLLDTPAVAIR